MPWYYAGPEAKPVGPVSLEELHARRLGGAIAPETYVIEHTGRPGEPREWKRYQDLFPDRASVPPPPPTFPAPATLPPVPAHPLFPSAASSSMRPPVFAPDRMPHLHAPRPANALCLWGFILSLVGLPLALACGMGLLLALPGFFLCLFGIFQVSKNPAQSGRGLAFWGMGLSVAALLVALFITIAVVLPMVRSGDWTITEQTTNDSD